MILWGGAPLGTPAYEHFGTNINIFWLIILVNHIFDTFGGCPGHTPQYFLNNFRQKGQMQIKTSLYCIFSVFCL